jgi:hypothetical protein
MRAHDAKHVLKSLPVRRVHPQRPFGGLRLIPVRAAKEQTADAPAFDLYKVIPLVVLIVWCILDAAAIRLPF